jgi:hypothetical protein
MAVCRLWNLDVDGLLVRFKIELYDKIDLNMRSEFNVESLFEIDGESFVYTSRQMTNRSR